MKKTSLAFTSMENLLSFVDVAKGTNLIIMPNTKIINAAFSDEEVELALKQFGAVIITSTDPFVLFQFKNRQPLVGNLQKAANGYSDL